MRAVNLLPDPSRRKAPGRRPEPCARRRRRSRSAAGVALVLVAVVVGLAFTQARSDVSDRQATLDGLQAEVAQQACQAAARPVTAAAGAVTARRRTSPRSRRRRPGGRPGTACSTSSRASCRAAPGSRRLQATAAPAGARPRADFDVEHRQRGRDVERPASSGSTTPARATSRSRAIARSQATVPRVLERLALIPALSDVSLQSTRAAPTSRQEGNASSRSAPTCAPRRERLMKDKLSPNVVAALRRGRDRRRRADRLVRPRLAAALEGVGPRSDRSPRRRRNSSSRRRTARALGRAKRAPGRASRRHGLALTRAMPRSVAMPGVLRQLLRAAHRAGVRLDSVTPQGAGEQQRTK